jgi:transcriptional regulator with XRE-family HTH domain
MRHIDASNPIGVRLRARMHQCGFSSTELARRAEVKTSFIYDVLSGKSANPSPLKLARLAQAMGVSLSALVEPHNAPLSPASLAKKTDDIALAHEFRHTQLRYLIIDN